MGQGGPLQNPGVGKGAILFEVREALEVLERHRL